LLACYLAAQTNEKTGIEKEREEEAEEEEAHHTRTNFPLRIGKS
jgi:hypothetical protein